MAAIAYTILTREIVAHHGPDSMLATAVGKDRKAKISLAAYAAAVPLAFVEQWVSDAIFVLVAAMWLVPDKRIESRMDEH
jgi:uncharacterized membrane protein